MRGNRRATQTKNSGSRDHDVGQCRKGASTADDESLEALRSKHDPEIVAFAQWVRRLVGFAAGIASSENARNKGPRTERAKQTGPTVSSIA